MWTAKLSFPQIPLFKKWSQVGKVAGEAFWKRWELTYVLKDTETPGD
jgi:hypothetical protein